MSKLFSDSTPEEFKNEVTNKIEEAKVNGTSELKDEENDLLFADLGDSVIAEDKLNEDEVTRFSDNPDDENDIMMEAVDTSEVDDDDEEMIRKR